MRIERVAPPPLPPREVALIFPVEQGWAVHAALYEYAEKHPDAANVDEWRNWARALDKELRS